MSTDRDKNLNVRRNSYAATRLAGAGPSVPGFLIDFLAFNQPALVTFSRSGSRTYVGADSQIATASANQWPMEYNPATGLAVGRAVYGPATNLALYSKNFTNAVWVPNGVTVSQTITGPDGVANSAARLTCTTEYGALEQNVFIGYTQRVVSFWCRGVGATPVRVGINAGAGVTPQELPVGGWKRIWARSTGGGDVDIFLPDVGTQVDVYGAQLDNGYTMGQFVPTVGSSASAVGDLAQITDLSELGIDATKGTLIIHAYGRGGLGILCGWEGDANNYFRVLESFGMLQVRVCVGGVENGLDLDLNTSNTWVNQEFKLAISYTGSAIKASINGGAVQSVASANPLASMTKFTIGSSALYPYPWNGPLRRIEYSAVTTSDAALQALTVL